MRLIASKAHFKNETEGMPMVIRFGMFNGTARHPGDSQEIYSL